VRVERAVKILRGGAPCAEDRLPDEFFLRQQERGPGLLNALPGLDSGWR